MDDYDDMLPTCPACFSDGTTFKITQDDINEALFLVDIYNIIARIDIMTQQFRCENCGYQW